MKYLAILLALLLCPAMSWASPTWIAKTESTHNTVSVNQMTTSITVSAGSNTTLVLAVFSASSTANSPATSATFNTSENFTLGSGCTSTNTSGAVRWIAQLYYLANPTATTANVVVNWGNTSNDRAIGYAVHQVNGTNMASPFDSCHTATGASTSISNTLTTGADDELVIDAVTGSDGTTWTVGTGTQRVNASLNTGGNNEKEVSSSILKASAGAQAMTWTSSVAIEWASVAIAIKPAAAAVSGCNGGLIMMGVGGC